MMDNRISEEIDQGKKSDQTAISKLYQDNYADVLFAIRSVVKDQDKSMDLLQDTFVKAFNSLEQLKAPDKFTPWVKQIAVNNALQYVKKKGPFFSARCSPVKPTPNGM